jgi:hypothetical protein
MAYPTQVTDVRSSPNEQIAHAATVLRKSKDRKRVFEAIYSGKRKVKTVSRIVKMAGLDRIRVLQEGKVLVNNNIVRQVKLERETAYEKDSFFSQYKSRILSLAADRRKLERFPTKYNPRTGVPLVVTVRIPKQLVQTKHVTVDDIGNFRKAWRIERRAAGDGVPIAEGKFKAGIKELLGEAGHFQDWGGEQNDLLSTRVRLDGKRKSTAFAFKGKGQRGTLTPKLMGKNGDQIQRLFRSPVELFLLQYWGQISESVLEQMKDFASLKSVHDGKKIYFGIIDGTDTARLIAAYPKNFK